MIPLVIAHLYNVKKGATFFIGNMQFIKISDSSVSTPLWKYPPNAVCQNGSRAGHHMCIHSNKEVKVMSSDDLYSK